MMTRQESIERNKQLHEQIMSANSATYAIWSRTTCAGTHVKMIKERPVRAQEQFEHFLEEMSKYPTFKILTQSQSATPMGVCIYITYKI